MKHGSLFSGIGGIDLGFEMAGIETTWTCELDDWANGLLQKRFPNATHYRDVQEIGKDNLESVDIISGGFPCQDISTAGKGAGLDGKRSGLWFEMWRIICELQPRWVLIENVANLANKGGARVLHDLAKAGYDAEWQVISARDVGARHLRKRLWIIAYRQEISDTLCERFQGQLHSSKGKDRHQVRGKWTDKSSIQTRNPEISNTNSNKHNGGTVRKSREKSIRGIHSTKEEQTSYDLWGKASRCDNVSTQTTSKRRTKQDIKRQDNRDGKFRIKAFERLKDEPQLDRVAYGLSQKVDRYNDRVKGLGNAVVPQIPYQLGKRIMKLNKIINE
tara:strand:+ start:191 stop:1186 length:996 start_codon:yes stop_codon:yes gene_type:complete